MRDILARALERTAALWPDVASGAHWVRTAMGILNNADHAPAAIVTARYERWLAQLEQIGDQGPVSDALRQAAQHFVKVTRSYGAHLFHCYDMPGLPRTNNVLEQTFGSVRYHERRASGRKMASPALVLLGSARLPAALYTRNYPVTVEMLAAVPQPTWRTTRAQLEARRRTRCLRYRFRKNPAAYLANLEQDCAKLSLPS